MMRFSNDESTACRHLTDLALAEDLGGRGDVTSMAVLPPGLQGRAVFLAKADGVVAGLPAAEIAIKAVDAKVAFDYLVQDGQRVHPGTRLAGVQGSMRSILAAERTALNFLQHLSGVATKTRRFVDAVQGQAVKILDTRKTLPGWRLLEKYAVRCGGGHNHRLGLWDAVLIKDNHLESIGSDKCQAITEAIGRVRERAAGLAIEVEVNTLEQFDRALEAGPDVIMLDNMSDAETQEAVRRRNACNHRVQLEVSGNVTLERMPSLAALGIDRISIGGLTHSAPALDISLEQES